MSLEQTHTERMHVFLSCCFSYNRRRMDSATKVNAEMCKDSVRLLGALIVVENMGEICLQ